MADLSVTDDPTASLVEQSEANARIIPDEGGMHERVVFLGGERERIEQFLDLSIAKAKLDHSAAYTKRDTNKRAYEALSDKGENITLPWCRQMTNQQHAWLVNMAFSKDPLISCQAIGDSTYEIVIEGPEGYEKKTVTAADEATAIEALLNYKWKYRLPMRKVLSDWAMEGLQDGSFPAITKLIHDEYKVTLKDRKAPYEATDTHTKTKRRNDKGQTIQIVNDPEARTIVKGESIQIINVPGEKLLKPISALDLQRSPWIAMETEESVSETRQKISLGKQRGGYDFCRPDEDPATEEEIDFALHGTENPEELPSRRASRAGKEVSRLTEADPTAVNVVYETYFRWPILTESETPEIVWTELVGYYHAKAKMLLGCWKLGTWNGERPFIDWFARQRPNAYSGTCPVEDVAPFQRYASNLFHLQVQNMVMRNVSVFFVRKGSASATFLKGRKLKPGMVVEFDEPGDVESKPLGTPIESIANEITFLKSGAQEMSLVTQYDNATADLSRVTAGAFAQQQDLAKMQPELVYESFAAAISKLALMYVQWVIQYAPEQKLPTFDVKTDAIINGVLYLPRQMVTDAEFAFTVKATPRDETKEAEFQRDLQLAGQIQNANNALLGTLGAIMKPGIPPPFIDIGMRAIARGELALEAQLQNTRHDVSKYVIPQEVITNGILQLQQWQQQMMQQQAMMGGNGGQVSNAGGGGVVPAGPGGPEGLPEVPPELGGQGIGPMGPQ